MKRLLFILLPLAASLSSRAQTPHRWTMEECMQYAVENSLDVSSLRLQGGIVREDYRQAIASLFPSVGASTGASFNFGRGLDADTNTYKNQNSFSNDYSVNASVTLFSGLSAVNRVRMERVNRAGIHHRASYRRDMVAYETMESFLQLQYDMELVRLTGDQLAESELNLSQTSTMERLGLKGMPDVVEMEAKVAADRLAHTRQQNRLAISVILLKEKMNYPLSEPLEIEPYDAAAIPAVEQPADAVYAAALGHNPKALAAESSYRAAELSRKITRAALFPTLSANGGWGTNFARSLDSGEFLPYGDQFRGKRGFYAGVSLSIPLFAGLSRSGNLRKSNYQLRIAANQREAELRSLYSEIEQAVTDASGQAEEYRQAVKQREAMRLAHDVNRRKYEEGLISVLEFHTSANRLLQAMIEEKQAEVRLYMKRKLVAYYAGEPLINE